MEMHNSFEKQDSIHRDAICPRTLSGYIPSLQNTVPFDSKRVAMCLRRKRAEVTNFSTWGGTVTGRLGVIDLERERSCGGSRVTLCLYSF
jgi:hypothetical protein